MTFFDLFGRVSGDEGWFTTLHWDALPIVASNTIHLLPEGNWSTHRFGDGSSLSLSNKTDLSSIVFDQIKGMLYNTCFSFRTKGFLGQHFHLCSPVGADHMQAELELVVDGVKYWQPTGLGGAKRFKGLKKTFTCYAAVTEIAFGTHSLSVQQIGPGSIQAGYLLCVVARDSSFSS